MNKHSLTDISIALKKEKEQIKSSRKTANNKTITTNSHTEHAQLIFPDVHYKPTKSDKAFQWYFNGFIVKLDRSLLIVDPGADFYTRFTNMGLDLNDVGAIFVSHEHIDHAASLSVLVDMLIRLGKPLDLIMPKDCLKTRLSTYLADEILSGSTNINLVLLTRTNHELSANLKFIALSEMRVIRHLHTARQTFGFTLKVSDETIAYISDTGYATKLITDKGVYAPDEVQGKLIKIGAKHSSLKRNYSSASHAVVNINDIAYSRHAKYHLTAWDVQDIFLNSSLKHLYIQHQPPINVRGEPNNINFCEFFAEEKYVAEMPFGEIKDVL